MSGVGITALHSCPPTKDARKGNMNAFIEIELTKGHKTIFDDCDADLALLKWSARESCGRVYAMRTVNETSEIMHRVILGRKLGRKLSANEQVDHIEGVGLDNRRKNLRLATKAQNAFNKKLHTNNTSGYMGVCWSKYHKRWAARVQANNKSYHLGYFDDVLEAALAYDAGARKYHGEFASTNF